MSCFVLHCAFLVQIGTFFFFPPRFKHLYFSRNNFLVSIIKLYFLKSNVYTLIKIPFCRQSVEPGLAPPPDGKGEVLMRTLWLDQATPWSAHHRQTTSYPERKEIAIMFLWKDYERWQTQTIGDPRFRLNPTLIINNQSGVCLHWNLDLWVTVQTSYGHDLQNGLCVENCSHLLSNTMWDNIL